MFVKRFLLGLGLFLSFSSFGQFGLGGGVTYLKGFGISPAFVGLHITGELPKDDLMTFYGRLTTSFYGENKDSWPLYVQNPVNGNGAIISYRNAMNHLIIEGGNRIYLGNGYDSGFGLYGGGNMQFIFNGAKRRYDYDTLSQAEFPLPTTEESKGSLFSIAIGLNGGLKHTFSGIGTLYLDATVGYTLLTQPSNNLAIDVYNDLFSPLTFNLSLGFRKEFY